MLELFFLLLVGHAVADYAMQSDYIVAAKNRNDTERDGKQHWFWVLSAHCLINGGAVYLVTGSFLLALCETILHFFIDFSKNEKWISYEVDQTLHWLCKVLWTVLFFSGIN